MTYATPAQLITHFKAALIALTLCAQAQAEPLHCHVDQSGEWQVVVLRDDGSLDVIIRGDEARDQCVEMTIKRKAVGGVDVFRSAGLP